MVFRKIFGLLVISFNHIMSANHDTYTILIINKTNLPIKIEQASREISLCRAFANEQVKIQAGLELFCLVSKRKHRSSSIPIKIVPSIDTISLMFWRENGQITARQTESDPSSEEIE